MLPSSLHKPVWLFLITSMTGGTNKALVVKPCPTFTDPSHLLGGHSHHQDMVFHILGHHRTAADHRPSPDGDAAHDGGVGSDGRSFLHQCLDVGLSSLGILCPWSQVIGEDTGGATEDVVLQRHPLVKGDVVLELAAIPDGHVIGYIDILAKGALLSDTGSTLHMTEVPDFCSLPYDDIIVDAGGGVDIPITHSNLPVKSRVEQDWRGSLTGFPSLADL